MTAAERWLEAYADVVTILEGKPVPQIIRPVAAVPEPKP